MKNFLYEYGMTDGFTGGEISVIALSRVKADELVRQRIADREMTEVEEILFVDFIKEQAPNANGSFYECEGCQ